VAHPGLRATSRRLIAADPDSSMSARLARKQRASEKIAVVVRGSCDPISRAGKGINLPSNCASSLSC